MRQLKNKRLKIKIKNSQKRIAINSRDIADFAKRVLKTKAINQAELSILFVGPSRIRRLNKRFRNEDLPTDVLAFSMREGKAARLHPEILGDLVICPEIARKQARIFKTGLKREIYLYLVHGVLHLLGWRDKSSKERSLIRKEEQRILRKLM